MEDQHRAARGRGLLGAADRLPVRELPEVELLGGREGTRIAARAGAVIGAIMIGLGLAIGVLTDDAFRGIMLAGVGLMVRQAARAEELRARLTSGPFGPGGFGPGPASARIPDSVQVVRLPDGQIAVIRDPRDVAASQVSRGMASMRVVSLPAVSFSCM